MKNTCYLSQEGHYIYYISFAWYLTDPTTLDLGQRFYTESWKIKMSTSMPMNSLVFLFIICRLHIVSLSFILSYKKNTLLLMMLVAKYASTTMSENYYFIKLILNCNKVHTNCSLMHMIYRKFSIKSGGGRGIVHEM